MVRPTWIALVGLACALVGAARGGAIAPPRLPSQTPSPCGPAGPTLATAAANHRLWIGTAVNHNALDRDPHYRHCLAQEFNLVTAENAMKLHRLQPRPHEFDFTQADRLMAFAAEHQLAVRGHTLVWHEALPDWLNDGDWTRDQLIALLEHHIKTLVGRYRGQIVAWDVVNEAIADDGTLRDSFWLRGIGPDYIAMAFRWAHEADPSAQLFYNDYGGEGLNPKADAIYELVRSLQAEGVPIHGVGLQMHVVASAAPRPPEVAANMARLADLGLAVQITEMDVRTYLPATAADVEQQAQIYAAMLQTCLQAPNCDTFVTWGFTDRYSWVPRHFEGWGEALPLDRDYRAKPAYHRLLATLTSWATTAP
ncbi:MAG TPA: endo-1,4-beta-xylanase [Nodosilinea sp.]|nr:endo-1,4-beta-xylanase [Nodosilinea sp.]